MILLVTASSRAKECAAAIEQKTHIKTQIASSLSKAVAGLETHDYDTLVLDESFQQVENGIEGLVTSHAGMAVPIYVNLALHGTERVALEVNCGIQRLASERLASMRAARNDLRSELRGEVTAILLNSELALRERSLPPSAVEKLRVVHELAERMRQKLETAPPDATGTPMKPQLVARQHA